MTRKRLQAFPSRRKKGKKNEKNGPTATEQQVAVVPKLSEASERLAGISSWGSYAL